MEKEEKFIKENKKLIYHIYNKYGVGIEGYEKDDVLQELKIVVYIAVEKYSESLNTSFSTYYYTLAIRRLMNLKRISKTKKRKAERIYSFEESSANFPETLENKDTSIEERVIINEDILKLKSFLDSELLSKNEKDVLKLLLENMDIQEIAKELKTTPKAIYGRKMRIVKKIRSNIKND